MYNLIFSLKRLSKTTQRFFAVLSHCFWECFGLVKRVLVSTPPSESFLKSWATSSSLLLTPNTRLLSHSPHSPHSRSRKPPYFCLPLAGCIIIVQCFLGRYAESSVISALSVIIIIMSFCSTAAHTGLIVCPALSLWYCVWWSLYWTSVSVSLSPTRRRPYSAGTNTLLTSLFVSCANPSSRENSHRVCLTPQRDQT